jgi:hypothetical protein
MWVGTFDCGLVAINVVPVAMIVVPMHPLVAINLGLKLALIAVLAVSDCEPLQLLDHLTPPF